MLRAVIIGYDSAICDPFDALLGEIGHVPVARKTPDYRLGARLDPFLRDHAPNLIFLCLKQFGQALECARQIEHAYPRIPIVALDRECPPAQLLELMRAGVRELITAPFERLKTAEVLARVRSAIEKAPQRFKESRSVFAFLAAQGGAGNSVVAANTAVALSEVDRQKSLLVDCDIVNGLSRLFFRGDPLYTLLDIAAEAHELDGDRWREMIMRHDVLDLVVAGRSAPDRRLEPNHMRNLINYARRSYETICLDVPNLTKVMLETLASVTKIFVVCTPEMHSLYMAREKHRFLAEHDLAGKVEFVLNRFHRKAQFTKTDCEEVLEQSICASFPNDYETVQRAIRAGCPVDAASQLGKSFRTFAVRIVQPAGLKEPERQRRFLEHFSVMPKAQAS
ncbi:MAG: hypothetical protein NTY38_16485 [Acidobacteria bacterium]|nr:hypothetical protein [Acidobacteriota bacterium]